jgi:hypothetical protein
LQSAREVLNIFQEHGIIVIQEHFRGKYYYQTFIVFRPDKKTLQPRYDQLKQTKPNQPFHQEIKTFW